jgi:hypothetical protein
MNIPIRLLRFSILTFASRSSNCAIPLDCFALRYDATRLTLVAL